NDFWELIALHHYGEPYLGLKGGVTLSNAALNEGIRISAIVADLRARLGQAKQLGGDPTQFNLIERVLKQCETASTTGSRKRLQQCPRGGGSESALSSSSTANCRERSMRDVTLVLPQGVTEATLTLRFSAPTGRPAESSV